MSSPETASRQNGLVLEGVKISLKGQVLCDLDLTVAPGEIVTLMGPSGAGKSSLLGYICGTLAPGFTCQGRVWLKGREIGTLPPQDRHVGILFQDDLLFPHLSVGGNLAFALPADIRGRGPRRDKIDQALEIAGLAGFADRDPATLSGGQRARVAVMRVLLSAPSALLLDEPFSRLDAKLRSQFREFVFDQARQQQLPTLMVTHDPEDANATGGPEITLTDYRA
ncbi:ATP-binding cassette domain-containing protein [Thalassospira sp. TSL5-1]|uniref:ATP-binding cassette domain-containing protein n=1 Tax=Thalassospira sp. TSL5-1 TaxID=1544451 RepID=UPI00093BB4EA|nr:ATP-binding cassette domain-containing protein [Thalassospira sp. TSL5-1]OKH89003.1 ABC transporter ATP-binding protein [Thalassospira sp. TSL5-1]